MSDFPLPFSLFSFHVSGRSRVAHALLFAVLLPFSTGCARQPGNATKVDLVRQHNASPPAEEAVAADARNDTKNVHETASTTIARRTKDAEAAEKKDNLPNPTAPALAEGNSDRLRELGYADNRALASKSKPAATLPPLATGPVHAEKQAFGAAPPVYDSLASAYGGMALASDSIAPAPPQDEGRERYQHLDQNPTKVVSADPVSTFSLDVDTGSYSNVRRFLAGGQRPPADAVRVEELVNYFPYDYPSASSEDPFGVRTELAPCPWDAKHWLMRVAVKAGEIGAAQVPAANLVFLIDVSGSMNDPNKLPLLQSSMKLLAAQTRTQDRISLVVYAGREAVVLEPTPGDQHERIARAIDQLTAGGSTAGEAGIRLAYRMARSAFVKGGINRVLLATDGDFNVGVTDFDQLKNLIERERESGVQFSTLGFGTGNYNEERMEQLADAGNGTYAYIDTLAEARKVLVDQVHSTLVTVAKDVKVQVEFNPGVVSEYRLIGYENRVLATEDFNNDKIDAGDVGAGQSVTALYELTPVGTPASVDALRYGAKQPAPERQGGERAFAAEVAFVKLRYKHPTASTSRLLQMPVEASALLPSFDKAGDDFRFATAVAGFGQLLRGGTRTGSWNWDDVLQMATDSRGRDEYGYRSEFLSLVRMAKVSS